MNKLFKALTELAEALTALVEYLHEDLKEERDR